VITIELPAWIAIVLLLVLLADTALNWMQWFQKRKAKVLGGEK